MSVNTTNHAVQSDSFLCGQVWKIGDSNLEIGLVGKLLVHYKHYRGKFKRAPISITSKRELVKLLLNNKAVLQTV